MCVGCEGIIICLAEQWLRPMSRVFDLCQLKICLLCSLKVNSVSFNWVSIIWHAAISIFYAFGPRLNVIEDPLRSRPLVASPKFHSSTHSFLCSLVHSFIHHLLCLIRYMAERLLTTSKCG